MNENRWMIINVPWNSSLAVPADVAVKVLETCYAVSYANSGLTVPDDQSVTIQAIDGDAMTAALVARRLSK